MNVRKAVDYSAMFAALGFVMDADLPQMELYCEIGKIVCARSEKGAAVAAAEFLKEQYPDMTGFSPRNVRRMRDFWQLYSGTPELLGEAGSTGEGAATRGAWVKQLDSQQAEELLRCARNLCRPE